MAKAALPWRKRRSKPPSGPEVLLVPRPAVPLFKRKAKGGGGKHSYAKPQWRFGDLLSGLGQDRVVTEKLVLRGYPQVPENSVTGWRLRNSIPSFWVPVLLQMAIEEKLIRRIEDLRVHN